MDTLMQDLRFGGRMLVSSPGFTAVIMLTLALGIGANTTIFSWINSTLLNPIPGVARAGDLVSVSKGEREGSVPPFSYADWTDLRDRSLSFSGLLAFHNGDSLALTGTGKPERIHGVLTSANYFDVLGVKPIFGRGFLSSEEQKPGGAPVAVIGFGLWQARFGSDRSIIGKTIQLNRQAFTVVGVAPPGFQGGQTGTKSDLWIPLVMDPVITSGWKRLYRRETSWLNLYGRLKPGVDRRQAQAELNLLMQQIAVQHPESHQGPNNITLDPLWRSPFGANSILSSFLPMLMAITGLVLLLACANVANLMLVRSVARRRELAIRLSMGAGRWRLVRQLLVESILIALAGGAIAMLLTMWSTGTFTYLIPQTSAPLFFDMRADRAVFLAGLVISIFTGMIFGILPALRSSRIVPVTVLKEEAGSVSGGLHKSRLARILVITQISLSLLLLICAGLFIRSFQAARQFDPGFDRENVLLASIDLLPAGYSAEEGIEVERQLIAKLEALPGVHSIALANWVPLGSSRHTQTINPEGYLPRLHESMAVMRANIGPNCLRTLRIPLVSGREFTLQDTGKSQPVVLVNQALADRYWPNQTAIGKRIQTAGKWFTVVGIAQNCNYRRLNEPPQPFLYLPLFQDFYHDAIIQVRVSGEPLAFASALERTVHELNAELPVFNVSTLEEQVRFAGTVERIAGTLVGAFGLIALALAAVGIYGVTSYTTRQRTREIGIRMALGAKRSDVFRLVLVQGLRLTLAGLGVGLVLSLSVTRLLRNYLFGVTSTDALTFVGVTLLLCLVALASSYIPARRATKVNPMIALRTQ